MGKKTPNKGHPKPVSKLDHEQDAKMREMLPAIYSRIVDEPVDYHENPTEAKLWARWAWWTGKYSIAEIAENINASDFRIRSWIHGTTRTPGWAEEKEKDDRRALRKAIHGNTVRMDKILKQMLDILERTGTLFIEDNKQLTIAEFNMITNAFEKLHKVRQLEMGRPTEIFSGEDGKKFTWSDIRKQIEEVDVVEFEVLDAKVNNK